MQQLKNKGRGSQQVCKLPLSNPHQRQPVLTVTPTAATGNYRTERKTLRTCPHNNTPNQQLDTHSTELHNTTFTDIQQCCHYTSRVIYDRATVAEQRVQLQGASVTEWPA
jgi:hypothetical protein